MKRVLLHLIILILVFSCGTKRVIYNNKSQEPIKEVKTKKEKPKKKKSKKVIIIPKILNTEDYVKYYSNIAMDEMVQFGIPASITLAHDWNGKKIYHDDDEEQECFRKYDSPEYSFRDHSLFLTNRGRYSFLFDFKRDDYKQWAKGLKKAGYATDPKYPQKLIDLIERYELFKYDNIVLKKKNRQFKVRRGDTLYSISEKFNMSISSIKRLNNLQGDDLTIGQTIIIKK